MFLTTHAIVSLTTLKISSNPIILFGLNFCLHYILDMIPHGDWGILKGFKNTVLNYIILFILDMSFVLLMLYSYINSNSYNLFNILCAVAGSIFPDILWGLYDITKLKFLKIFLSINHWAHEILGYQQEKRIYFLTQILVIIISLIIIY